MATTNENLQQLLVNLGVTLDDVKTDDDGDVCISYTLDVGSTLIRVFIDIMRNGELVEAYAYPMRELPGPISEAALERVRSRLEELNTKYLYGKWMLMNNEAFRVCYTFLLEDAELTSRQLARFHFLLADLVAHQMATLQLDTVLQTQHPQAMLMISTVVLRAVIDNPSQVKQICAAVAANNAQTKLLYEIAGEIYSEAENDREEAPKTPSQARH